MRINVALVISLLIAALVVAPREVGAGPFTEPGHAPAEMAAWATSVDDFVAGPLDIAQPGLGDASSGLPALALGPSLTGGVAGSSDVVSLGDGGSLTLYFDEGIADGLGNDFAVFENGFIDQGSGLIFGEFAFVEVSTNGLDFVRIPSTSLQAVPVGSFDVVDPTDYHNLAGDQLIGFGTGFDLHDLLNHPLVLDMTLHLADVRYVRIIDVIGDGSSVDQFGDPIYDPYTTAFPSGGFDAEAVGILNTVPEPAIAQSMFIGVAVLAALGRQSRRQSRRQFVRRPPCDPAS
jgi:hypothetical protein